MRLSWLDPVTVGVALDALRRAGADREPAFASGFEPPPPPDGIDPRAWPRIAEHVARAERVSEVVRAEGVDGAAARFADSPHAVEVAVVAMAAAQAGDDPIELIRQVLAAVIDEEILYGTFLRMLLERERARAETVAIYEQFVDAVDRHQSDHPEWADRAASVREGLADLYVASGRFGEGHALFLDRHEESRGDVTVALSASRAFLAAGERGRAIDWLGRAAERARQLGRAEMEATLRAKQAAIAQRTGS